MLLFDRVQQTAWSAPAQFLRDADGQALLVLRKMAELIRGAPVYVLDNIAPHLHQRFESWQEDEPDWRGVAPGARAPAERSWFEWSLAGIEQAPFGGWHRVGVLMRCQAVEPLRGSESVPGRAEWFWQPRIALWRSEASLPQWPPSTHRAFADRDGTILGVGRIPGPNAYGDYFTYCVLAIALTAVCFTDTRNVDQEVHDARASGPPGTRATAYRTFRIRPTCDRQAGTVSLDEEAYLRWHLVRGGWKLFTPERPLLGRRGAHGRYWVEPGPRAPNLRSAS